MAGAVKVLAFAGARDVIGASEVAIDVPGDDPTTADVLDALCRRYPRLDGFRSVLRIAVNGSYADSEQHVRPGDEVALIPPVAGG
jgi:molybdopterin converting factor subunit 1